MHQNQEKRREAKNDKVYLAETSNGCAVKNLVTCEYGWTGFVQEKKMIWDQHGITGKGSAWTLKNIRQKP